MFYLDIIITQNTLSNVVILFYAFLFMGAFIALLNWMRGKHKRLKLNTEESPNLEGYTFAFNTETSSSEETIPAKKLTIGRKVVMFTMAGILAVTPLYELIGTLKEDFYHYAMCCFC